MVPDALQHGRNWPSLEKAVVEPTASFAVKMEADRFLSGHAASCLIRRR